MIITSIKPPINRNINMLPILKKFNLLKTSQLKPLSKYHKVCLSVIIPHGLTDSLIYPGEIYVTNYLSSCLFFSGFPINLKFIIFFLYSIYHIRNDFVGGFIKRMLYSVGIHLSWCFFPEWSLTYLAWIHTALHYYKTRMYLSKIEISSFIICGIFLYGIMSDESIYKFIKDYIKMGMWIPIIIGHILNVN